MNSYGYQPLKQNSTTGQSRGETDKLNVVYERFGGAPEEAYRDLEIPKAVAEKPLTESIVLDDYNDSIDVRSSPRIEQRSHSAVWNPRQCVT